MYHYTETQNEKNHFVLYYLSDMLHAANEDIHGVTYAASEAGETVKVHMKNGADYLIDVTADSLMAIAFDVISFMKNK